MKSDEIDLSTRKTDSSDEPDTPIPRPRQSRRLSYNVDAKSNGIIRSIRGFFSNPFKPKRVSRDNKPELHHPILNHAISYHTDESNYDISNPNRGIAIIFNHENVNGQSKRKGTRKDGDDLETVLNGLQFEVRSYMDLKVKDIMKILYDVSKENHSNNDCLLVTVMSHGFEDGKISATDKDYCVEELFEKFLGDNCKSLVGKPKLFFIQACRGDEVDPGALHKQKHDQVDAIHSKKQFFVIPKMADLLVMYSTAEGHYSFRHPKDGSWFIQALCQELQTNPHEDLLRIVTAVNRRVAYGKKAKVPGNNQLDATKQMPSFVSTLTKTLYFTPKIMH